MSDLEALMWTLEPDPYLSSSFANISFFDRTPDHDRLRRRLWRASRVASSRASASRTQHGRTIRTSTSTVTSDG